jgi:DNA-binding MarR family transcriptional regulator
VERLVQSGHITRTSSPTDRRVQIIRMTPEGRRDFRRIAERHGDWIGELFSDLSPEDMDALMNGLAKLKSSVRTATEKEGTR